MAVGRGRRELACDLDEVREQEPGGEPVGLELAALVEESVVACRGRRLTDDQYLEIAPSGNAQRHAREGTEHDVAVRELQLIAGGRSGLLAVAAGRIIGGWLASPGMHHPSQLRTGTLLVEAGADPTLVTRWVDEGRANASGRGHSTPVTCSAWGLVRLILAMAGGEKRHVLQVDAYGNILRQG